MSGKSIALNVINKINSRLKFLHRKNRFLTPALCRLLYNALIQSHFDYASSAWYPNLTLKMKNTIQIKYSNKCKSSRLEIIRKKGVLRNFTKFTGKYMCQTLFFNKVPGLRRATLLKKRLWHRCFPVNFVKFRRTPFLTEHLW